MVIDNLGNTSRSCEEIMCHKVEPSLRFNHLKTKQPPFRDEFTHLTPSSVGNVSNAGKTNLIRYIAGAQTTYGGTMLLKGFAGSNSQVLSTFKFNISPASKSHLNLKSSPKLIVAGIITRKFDFFFFFLCFYVKEGPVHKATEGTMCPLWSLWSQGEDRVKSWTMPIVWGQHATVRLHRK